MTVMPAGVSGSPINLALTVDFGGDPLSLSSVLLSAIPIGATLSDGSHSFTATSAHTTVDVHAWNLANLTITAPVGFSGAVALNVSETSVQSNGSTNTLQFKDNVEVYQSGSPIFAWPGADTLTGSQGSDTFVFDHLIGNDIIYNFDTAADTIDLIGFANAGSFSDVQAKIADDANGNAVITLGTGKTITLAGVHAALLDASDFLFDQTPVMENEGTMVVGDNAILPLDGDIHNTGTIALNSAGAET